MKNGPPTIAVITPTGTSVGARMVRATVSQTARNAAPAKKEQGISRRWSAPSRSRSACGTIRPDEADRPGQRGHRARDERARQVARQHQPRGGDAARRRPLLAHRQQVPVARPPEEVRRRREAPPRPASASVEYSTASMPPSSQRTMAKDWPKSAMYCRKRMHARQMLLIGHAGQQQRERRHPPALAGDAQHQQQHHARAQQTPPPRSRAGRRSGASPAEMAITAPSEAPLETPSV